MGGVLAEPLLESYVSGEAWQAVERPAKPAAGVELVHTVQGQFYERLRIVRATFVASAVVAARAPALVIDDGQDAFFTMFAPQDAAAGETWIYEWVIGLGAEVAARHGTSVGLLPEGLFLPPTWRVRTSTLNLDPGDQWSLASFLVDRFSTDPALYRRRRAKGA